MNLEVLGESKITWNKEASLEVLRSASGIDSRVEVHRRTPDSWKRVETGIILNFFSTPGPVLVLQTTTETSRAHLGQHN